MKKFKALVLYFSFLLILAVLWFSWATGPVDSQTDQSKIFVIQKGEATNSIIKRLRQEKLIRSSLAFNLLLYKEDLRGKIQAGDFRLKPKMSALEIGQELTHGTLDQWVTVIEGWRAEEIAAEFAETLSFSPSEFLEQAKAEEGYLFPDTYLIPKEASPTAVLKILKKNFDQKLASLMADIEKSDLSLKEVVILASLVEREAKHNEDRPIVAGILIKRWQNDWSLQVDATIQYLLGKEEKWWPQVTKESLKITSPYNTYLQPGLPPTPICNPGLASIKAVVHPEASEDWFYLSDSQGKIHYAKDLEAHNQNISRFLNR